MILIKDIYGVREGCVYPELIKSGEQCPENLVGYAKTIKAVETRAKKSAPSNKAMQAPETK